MILARLCCFPFFVLSCKQDVTKDQRVLATCERFRREFNSNGNCKYYVCIICVCLWVCVENAENVKMYFVFKCVCIERMRM